MTEKDFDNIYAKIAFFQDRCRKQIRTLRDQHLEEEVYTKKREYFRAVYNGLTLWQAITQRYERMHMGGEYNRDSLIALMTNMLNPSKKGESDGLRLGIYYIKRLVKA